MRSNNHEKTLKALTQEQICMTAIGFNGLISGIVCPRGAKSKQQYAIGGFNYD